MSVFAFCFLGDSFGQYIFELFARETNLKKKRSVIYHRYPKNIYMTVVEIETKLRHHQRCPIIVQYE